MGNEELKARVVFEVAYKNPKYNSLGIKIKMGDKAPWANAASEAVFNFAKNNFQKEEEANITYVLTETGKIKIIRIEKVKADSTPPKEPVQPDKSPEENKSVSNKPKTSSNGQYRAPEQITRDEVGLMVAKTMVSMQGFVHDENVAEIVKRLYKTYLQLVTE